MISTTPKNSRNSSYHSLSELNTTRIFQALLGIPIFGALFMFLPAGTIRWLKGWIFIGIFLISESIVAVYLWKTNPELLIARSHPHTGTKRWDKILLSFLFPSMIGIFIVAAFDDGRFHWLPIPVWSVMLGYFLFLVGFSVTVWAGKVNKFAEPTVRIQTDRGHTVVDCGPYHYVRHPGYAGGILMFFGMALALGSLWSTIPALTTTLLLIVRTELEDRTLRKELQGYEEYTQIVRDKLVPYVW